MTLGMLQLLAVQFPGNQFRGEIVPELEAIRDKGLARIVDLAFVYKDENGTAATVLFKDLSEEQRVQFGLSSPNLIDQEPSAEEAAVLGEGFGITDEDVDEIANEVPANSSVLIILAEHLWSLPLKQAIINANGQMIGNWIIQPELPAESGAKSEAAQAGRPA